MPAELEFFGDTTAQHAFLATLDTLSTQLGLTPGKVDFAPFKRVSALLYDGPWVAERRAALGAFFETNFADIDATVASVIGKADRFSAVDAFNGQYTLAELKREADRCFDQFDILIVPTTPTHPLIADVQANPIERNSELGYYTNFVNLLDLCALAVPCVRRSDGLPAGVTLIAPSGADHRLAVLGARIQALFDRTIRSVAGSPAVAIPGAGRCAGSGGRAFERPAAQPAIAGSGRSFPAKQPIPRRLISFLRLPNTAPPKPGLVRTTGAARCSHCRGSVGGAVAYVRQVRDGRSGTAWASAPWNSTTAAWSRASSASRRRYRRIAARYDITAFGGWLAYLDSLQNATH